jgi:hypothetical protein
MGNMVSRIAIVITFLVASTASADPREDFITAIGAATGDVVQPLVIDNLVTFKVGAKCWAKLLDKDQKGIYSAYSLAHNIVDWAKAVTGDDWWAIERDTGMEAAAKRELLEKKISAFKANFGLTIKIEGDDCNPKNGSIHVVAWEVIGGALRDYPPKTGKAFITLTFAAKAKGVSAASRGGKLAITLPRDVEPDIWQKPIQDAFRKVSAKK